MLNMIGGVDGNNYDGDMVVMIMMVTLVLVSGDG